jgi:hypothetical protein
MERSFRYFKLLILDDKYTWIRIYRILEFSEFWLMLQSILGKAGASVHVGFSFG